MIYPDDPNLTEYGKQCAGTGIYSSWEEADEKRLRNKHRSWYYRIRKSLDLFHLMETDWQQWRHGVGSRVGNYDILWTQALSIATLTELQDLDTLRSEKRLEI